jgi:Zn-dependent metalloprotease
MARSPVLRKALLFLRTHFGFLGIQHPGQLDFVHSILSGSGTHIRFQQVYHGLPIIGALLDVHVDGGGAVCMVSGTFHGIFRMDHPLKLPPRMTKKDALAIAQSDLGARCVMRARIKTDELIYLSGGIGRRVYKVILPTARPLGNWVYLINPFTGAIVRSYNTMRFARGRGRVYLSNPAEDPSLRVVQLNRMTDLTGLRGDHVTVVNEDYPEARSANGAFLYMPVNTHFDEVMVYYHVDHATEFFLGLDQSVEGIVQKGGSIQAFVHAGDAMDNAYYDPATGGLYFGDGGGRERMNDLAREAAVVYHEYTHVVLDRINPHLKGDEADALHEGYADYFACSMTDDAQIGEWVVARRGEPHLRDLSNGKTYPHDLKGEAHADGEIWSGACWNLRTKLGKRKADSLVYESMHFLPEFASFMDAATGLVQADENMFSGRHRKRIAGVFAKRGLDVLKADRSG